MTLLSWILLTVIFVILAVAIWIIDGLGNLCGGMANAFIGGRQKKETPWVPICFAIIAIGILIKTITVAFSHITLSIH